MSEIRYVCRRTNDCRCAECEVQWLNGEVAHLRDAATLAHAVLTRLADSAYQWAGRDVPPGLVSEIDEAKARLAGALSREARP